MSSAYDFEALSITGKKVALSQYKGQPMLIVNTASACGFTPQFAGLETLHETYGKKGLVVLGFPATNLERRTLATTARLPSSASSTTV